MFVHVFRYVKRGWQISKLLSSFTTKLSPFTAFESLITLITNVDKWTLNLSDPASDFVRQYDFPVLLWCRKTSDTVFVAFVRPLWEPVRRLSSCSTDFSQQIAQVVLFLYLHFFLF
jgi:hypothetical protein